MPDFVSTPRPPRKARVPVVTLDALIDALVEYLPTAFDFVYHHTGIDPSRELGMAKTNLNFYDARRAIPEPAIRVEIDGKFAQSVSSKLYSDPFIVSIWKFSEGRKRYTTGEFSSLLIIPQADRSLRLRPVKRWDRGMPIFED